MDGKNSEYHTKSKLLTQVKWAMRTRNYSPRTITTYVQWIKRFILFHNKTHPTEMGKGEVRTFLTYLAVEQNVAPSTQNQALQALLFQYRDVPERRLSAGLHIYRLVFQEYTRSIERLLSPTLWVGGCW